MKYVRAIVDWMFEIGRSMLGDGNNIVGDGAVGGDTIFGERSPDTSGGGAPGGRHAGAAAFAGDHGGLVGISQQMG